MSSAPIAVTGIKEQANDALIATQKAFSSSIEKNLRALTRQGIRVEELTHDESSKLRSKHSTVEGDVYSGEWEDRTVFSALWKTGLEKHDGINYSRDRGGGY